MLLLLRAALCLIPAVVCTILKMESQTTPKFPKIQGQLARTHQIDFLNLKVFAQDYYLVDKVCLVLVLKFYSP